MGSIWLPKSCPQRRQRTIELPLTRAKTGRTKQRPPTPSRDGRQWQHRGKPHETTEDKNRQVWTLDMSPSKSCSQTKPCPEFAMGITHRVLDLLIFSTCAEPCARPLRCGDPNGAGTMNMILRTARGSKQYQTTTQTTIQPPKRTLASTC